jgi:hypothetical protein
MLRSLIRSGLVLLFVLSLSAPVHALPLGGEREGFTLSLSALWERLVSPIVSLWTGSFGTCVPKSSGTTSYGGGATTQGSGACDPNG